MDPTEEQTSMAPSPVIPLDRYHDDSVGCSPIALLELSQVLEESETSFSFPPLGSSQATSDPIAHEQSAETAKVRSTLSWIQYAWMDKQA